MPSRKLRVPAVALTAGLIGLGACVGPTAASSFDELTGVPAANPKSPGFAAPNILSPELTQSVLAQGSFKLENATPQVPYYGYDGDGPHLPAPGDKPAAGHKVEATKTEPDKNTYLTIDGLKGADPKYDYGRHFLFQGHEGGSPGYITRINLDADGAHRVTLLATADDKGTPLPTIDGSTWDPWAKRLLFTAEKGNQGGVWQATTDVPAKVRDISGALGRGGYEGIQNDSAGNLWIVEDVGGPAGTANPRAKQPNSFVYRFVPKDRKDLTKGGSLQALQVISLRSGKPIVFHAGQADADILSDDVKDLHTYDKVFDTRWVTIHDADADGMTPFDANALAKGRGATPLKRPENGQFRPGTRFGEFYFDETGDTNKDTEAGAQYGGFGAVVKLTQRRPTADTGKLTLFYRSDVAHSGFDNVAFFGRDRVAFVEDAGDGLHTQRNALDSGYMFDVNENYGAAQAPAPLRFLAQGRDASATIDSGFSGMPGFQNDGDNEITGLHVSDGDPATGGILGAKTPTPLRRSSGWRVFYTQQHGDNATYEVNRAPGG
jgi:hypothetical protein